MQRLRFAQCVFSVNLKPFSRKPAGRGRVLPQTVRCLFFQDAMGLGAYSINTPARVSSGIRSGVGGAIRLRTICIGWPQHGQRNAARGFTQAVRDVVGMTFNTSCNNAISRLLLGCRKPKLRARPPCQYDMLHLAPRNQ